MLNIARHPNIGRSPQYRIRRNENKFYLNATTSDIRTIRDMIEDLADTGHATSEGNRWELTALADGNLVLTRHRNGTSAFIRDPLKDLPAFIEQLDELLAAYEERQINAK